MNKELLKKMLEKRQAKLAALHEKSKVSEDINEVRAIGVEVDEINAEIRDLEAQLASIEERGFNPLGTYGLRGNGNPEDNENVEYRSAFMNYVLRGTAIPTELRADANTLTSDVNAVIPTVLVNKIIERMEQTGMILARVARTAYAAGVNIPKSTVKPVATWVAEGAGSDRQKKSTTMITFAYHKLRCEISMSMEVGTMALAAFEAKFIENVAKAMVIAIEKAILAGTGVGQPKGILTEDGVEKEIAGAIPTYDELVDIEMAVPVEYDNTAVWFMTKAQFGNFLKMKDQAGQPIARVNYGLTGKPQYDLLGREVLPHPYAEEMGTLAGAIVDFNDYVLNTIYDMGITKKQDWETEDLLTKAVMSVDGKLVDDASLIKVTKKA